MHSYLSREISELLSEIEKAAFGISGSTELVFAAREIGKIRTIALLILPPEQEKSYQICFAVGEKRRRKQRTMNCTFYKAKFAGTQSLIMRSSNMFDGWRSCLQYAQYYICPHHKAIFENNSNRMRPFGMDTRNLSPARAEYRNQQWETFCVPFEEKDDVILLVVF